MLLTDCTGWVVPVGTLKGQLKSSFLFPLTFPVKLLLVRSEAQWPCQGGNWKMGLVGRYDSKALFGAQISSLEIIRVSNTKMSASRCHQACTGRNFTQLNESAAVEALSLKKCSDSISVPLFILLLLLHSAGSLFHSFYSCCAPYCFPLHEHLSWSSSCPLPLRANGPLSPDWSLMVLHRSYRRKWLLNGWQSTFYLSLEPECTSAFQH